MKSKLLILAIVTVFVSCQKKTEIPETSQLVMKITLTTTNNEPIRIYDFKYINKVISEVAQISSNPNFTGTYFFKDGRIDSASFAYGYDKYFYYSDTLSIVVLSDGVCRDKGTYPLDENGNPIEIVFDHEVFTTYTWLHGNCTKIITKDDSITMTYGNEKNPLRNIKMPPMFPIYFELKIFNSENNIKTSQYKNSNITNYTYENNEYGNPVVITAKDETSGEFDLFYHYEYY